MRVFLSTQLDKIKYTLFQGLGRGGGWDVSFLILQILGGFIRGSDGFGRSGHQSACNLLRPY